MKLATFDIFDTALIRKCGTPDIIPHIVASRLWPDDEMAQCEFVNARRQAASAAASNSTIAELYSTEYLCSLPGYSAEEIMHEELETEADLLVGNRLIVNKIRELRIEGWTIKFLSDMYLPSEWLKCILEREGCAEPDDEIIVSCEWGARKDDGSLYRKVRERYTPIRWKHFGDNRRSDYRMARRNRVDATLIDSSFTAVEKRICNEGRTIRSGWRMTLLAGISRAVRLRSGDTPAQRLAADYVGALYIPFVLWVLRNASRKGLKRLHFLSRDGYIMMKIAETLQSDSELNYLFVSRRSLMRAYLTDNTASRYIEIADRRTLIMRRVDHLLWQLQLDRNKLKSEYGIEFGYDKIQTAAQQDDFLNKLFAHKEFTPNLLSLFTEDARLTEAYLRQEGLNDGSAQAMVDIGWLGTSRHMVNKILGTNIPTYYVGIRGDVYPRTSGDFASYFDCGQLSTEATGLIENYFSASPWPSTTGYTIDDHNEIVPEFGDGHEFAQTPTSTANIDICCSMTRELKPYIHLLDDDSLFKWANISLESITKMQDRIDLSPIVENSDFDGIAMVRKFNVLELFNFALLGRRYTAFDRASVELTVGHFLAPGCCKLHSCTSRVRGRLYRAYLRLKK